MYDQLTFEIKHYTRLDTFMVRVPGEGYLRLNKNTGGVQTIHDASRATFVDSRKDAVELIEWYIEETPIETETLEYVKKKKR